MARDSGLDDLDTGIFEPLLDGRVFELGDISYDTRLRHDHFRHGRTPGWETYFKVPKGVRFPSLLTLMRSRFPIARGDGWRNPEIEVTRTKRWVTPDHERNLSRADEGFPARAPRSDRYAPAYSFDGVSVHGSGMFSFSNPYYDLSFALWPTDALGVMRTTPGVPAPFPLLPYVGIGFNTGFGLFKHGSPRAERLAQEKRFEEMNERYRRMHPGEEGAARRHPFGARSVAIAPQPPPLPEQRPLGRAATVALERRAMDFGHGHAFEFPNDSLGVYVMGAASASYLLGFAPDDFRRMNETRDFRPFDAVAGLLQPLMTVVAEYVRGPLFVARPRLDEVIPAINRLAAAARLRGE